VEDNASAAVKIIGDDLPIHWQLTIAGQTSFHDSIGALLAALHLLQPSTTDAVE